ncbi:MAG: hypothetical protein M4579_007442 [Chaenotheca gracillima]|nr:MAG: hypothetical protein M4579_007442 [Chaenotheca gracillima]
MTKKRQEDDTGDALAAVSLKTAEGRRRIDEGGEELAGGCRQWHEGHEEGRGKVWRTTDRDAGETPVEFFQSNLTALLSRGELAPRGVDDGRRATMRFETGSTGARADSQRTAGPRSLADCFEDSFPGMLRMETPEVVVVGEGARRPPRKRDDDEKRLKEGRETGRTGLEVVQEVTDEDERRTKNRSSRVEDQVDEWEREGRVGRLHESAAAVAAVDEAISGCRVFGGAGGEGDATMEGGGTISLDGPRQGARKRRAAGAGRRLTADREGGAGEKIIGR